MTIEMRPHIDSFPSCSVVCATYGSGNLSGATTRAENVCNLTVDAAGVCLKALTDVDGHIGVRSVNHAIVRALAITAKPKASVENFGCRELASILCFVPPSSFNSNQLGIKVARHYGKLLTYGSPPVYPHSARRAS
jgi:hypothetical protein